MKRTILVSSTVIAFLWPACAQARIVYYEVIDLGTLGGDESVAYSINNVGQVVGVALNSQGDPRACLFDPTGGGNNIELGTLGGDEGEALCINDAGQIVGWAQNGQGWERATLFDPAGAGNNLDLGTLGGDYSWAGSINDAGQIVGCAENSGYDVWATLFDPAGARNNLDLGTLGGDWSEAYSINDAGQIVGWAQNSENDLRATLFDPTGAGNNVDLGTLGGDDSWAECINEAGRIVGTADNNQGWPRATLFDHTGAGSNIDLGTLGGNWSEAYSINEAGQIVGSAENWQGYSRAALFAPTGSGNNIDLNSLKVPNSGWTLECAYDINGFGWIVGKGVNPQGEEHAFLLVPEPATFGCSGWGYCALGNAAGALSFICYTLWRYWEGVRRGKMMKKLMIMSAVLAMATAANAGLVLDPPWLDWSMSFNIQTDPIDVADVQQAVFVAVRGDFGLDAGTMVYGGDLSAITDLTGLDPDLTAAVEAVLGEAPTRIDLVEFFDSTATPPDVIGVLASYRVTAGPCAPSEIVLLNSNLEVLSTVNIPEPGAFILLGLGILCLRRRSRRS